MNLSMTESDQMRKETQQISSELLVDRMFHENMRHLLLKIYSTAEEQAAEALTLLSTYYRPWGDVSVRRTSSLQEEKHSQDAQSGLKSSERTIFGSSVQDVDLDSGLLLSESKIYCVRTPPSKVTALGAFRKEDTCFDVIRRELAEDVERCSDVATVSDASLHSLSRELADMDVAREEKTVGDFDAEQLFEEIEETEKVEAEVEVEIVPLYIASHPGLYKKRKRSADSVLLDIAEPDIVKPKIAKRIDGHDSLHQKQKKQQKGEKIGSCKYCMEVGAKESCGYFANKCPNRLCSRCNRRHRYNRCRKAWRKAYLEQSKQVEL